MSELTWIAVSARRPPEDVPVRTKIDDEHGCRNEGELVLHWGRWFLPDMSMYVYYTPTHWRLP